MIIYQANAGVPGAVWISNFCSRSILVTYGHVRVLLITFYRNVVDRWGWSHCVQLAKTHRLICPLAFSGHHFILRSRHLRSTLDIDLSGSTRAYIDAFRWEKHGSVGIIASTSFFKNNSRKTIWLFEAFDLSLEVNIWPEVLNASSRHEQRAWLLPRAPSTTGCRTVKAPTDPPPPPPIPYRLDAVKKNSHGSGLSSSSLAKIICLLRHHSTHQGPA